MRKLFSLAVIAMFAISASAQYYIGGSLSFESNTIKPKGGDKTTTTGFGFAPEFGYSLDDRTDIGLAIGFSNRTEKHGDNKDKDNTFRIAPYYRYTFLEFGKFQVAGQADLSFSTSKTKDESAGTVHSEYKNSGFGLMVAPVLKYNLSDKFTLLTNLNFANLGFTQKTTKDVQADTKTDTTHFGFGIDTDNLHTLGDITVGFVFKF